VTSGQAPQHRTFGDQVVAGLLQSTDRHKFDLQVTDRAGAMHKIDKADVYGAIVIPRDFTSASLLLAQSAATDTKAVRPVIEVVTNPRADALRVDRVQLRNTSAGAGKLQPRRAAE